MSARAQVGGGLVRAAAGAVVDFLVEPEAPEAAAAAAEPVVVPIIPPPPEPVVAVAGLGPRCGATVVARGLAAELSRRSLAGAAVVAAVERAAAGGPAPAPAATGLAAGNARRLVRQLAAGGVAARGAGRVALLDARADGVPGLTGRGWPVVLDVSGAACLANLVDLVDRVVLVGAPGIEPALAAAVAASLTRDCGVPPLVALARGSGDPGAWADRFDVLVPHSRLGAQSLLAGRPSRGAMAAGIAALADLVVEGNLAAQ